MSLLTAVSLVGINVYIDIDFTNSLCRPHLTEEEEIEASLIAFFDWLKQLASGDMRPMQQFFLLLSIHLHAAQCEQINALISSELKFKVRMCST